MSLPSVPAAKLRVFGLPRPGTGMLKAFLRLQSIHYSPRRTRPTGMLKPSCCFTYSSIDALSTAFVTKTITASPRRGHATRKTQQQGTTRYCYATVKIVQVLG